MKRGRKLIAAVVVAATLFSGTGVVFAKQDCTAPKEKKNTEGLITENMIKNLQAGIKSENAGLKASAIYYAGYYEIDELTDTLTDELSKTTDLRTKVLLSLALYKIGGNALLKGITAVL